MALARVSSSRTPLLLQPSTSSSLPHCLLRLFSSASAPRRSRPGRFPVAAAFSHTSPSVASEGDEGESAEAPAVSSRRPWKPTCLYYTQGKCTMMNDALHLEKFNHSLLMDLPVNASASDKVKHQKLDYLLVLDLEGKVEILEFPVIMIDAQSMKFIDSFHRFVRPTAMSEQRTREYIAGKYGKFGVDCVWHDTATPFKEVIQEFEYWLSDHSLWKKDEGRSFSCAAFVTCGNWDLKTKVPEQCRVSKIKLPSYFTEWINLKDMYFNFYKRRATGMMAMMRELQMPIIGSHHLGIDDAKNIARVVQHMLADGVVMQITANRHPVTGDVKFLFKNRIR